MFNYCSPYSYTVCEERQMFLPVLFSFFACFYIQVYRTDCTFITHILQKLYTHFWCYFLHFDQMVFSIRFLWSVAMAACINEVNNFLPLFARGNTSIQFFSFLHKTSPLCYVLAGVACFFFFCYFGLSQQICMCVCAHCIANFVHVCNQWECFGYNFQSMAASNSEHVTLKSRKLMIILCLVHLDLLFQSKQHFVGMSNMYFNTM